MANRISIAFALPFVVAACGSSPTAPKNTATSLTINQSTTTIARNTTLRLMAQVQTQAGATTDVTKAATWTSSNPAVATVAGGLVAVQGLGPVQISASYQGQTATSTITGRRRMIFDAKFLVQDSIGVASIDGLSVLLDGRGIMAEGQSGRINHASITVFGSGPQKPIDPGPHHLAVGLELEPGSHDLAVGGTTLTISDGDTGELLTTIPVAEQRGSKSNGDMFTWPIDVAVFTQ